MSRTIVDPIQVRENLRPAAQPVDTYVRPATPAPSQLHGLAEALSNFGGDLAGYLKDREAKQQAEDDIRGKAAAYKNNGLGYAEAVRKGSIPTFASPEFVKSYKQGTGELIGKRLASQFTTEYSTWGGRNDTDPAAFDGFMSDFLKKNMTTDDPDVLTGAMPFVSELTNTGYSINDKDRSTTLYNNNIDVHIANSAMDIDNADDLGIASGQGTDYDGLWNQLMSSREQALSVGMTTDDYDKAFVTMIGSKTLEHMDPAMLGMLGRKVPGQSYTYADTPQGQKIYADTINSLETAQAERSRMAAAAQAAADKEQKDKSTAFAVEALIKNPTAQFDDKFLTDASTVDPEFRIHVTQWRKTAAEPQPEDDATLVYIQQQVMAGAYGVQDLMKDMGTDGGPIHTTETASKLFTLINTVNDGKMKPLFDNDIYKGALSLLHTTLTPPAGDAGSGLGLDPGQMNTAAIAASLDYQQSMVGWFRNNPNAGYEDIAEQSAKVLGRIQKGMGGTAGDPSYQTPNGLGSDTSVIPQVDANGRPAPDTGVPENPLTTTTQETANQEAATPKEEPALQPWRDTQPPKYSSLTPDQQKRISEESDKRGISPEQYISILWGNMRQVAGEATTQDGQAVADQKPVAKAKGGPQDIGADVNTGGDGVEDLGYVPSGGGPTTGPLGDESNNFDTVLSGQDEIAFQKWKAENAPNDDGSDYDLRGAFAAGVSPDSETGHWPDTFKKPNEPTFSDQSQYAASGNPGHWDGDTFVPPAQPAAPDAENYAPEPKSNNSAIGAITAATSSDPMAVWGGEAPPEMTQLSGDQRKRVTREAEQLGIPTADYIANLYYRLKADHEGADSMTTKGFSPIADLIGKTEGTDKGRGYDEVIGYGQFGGKDTKVTGMTLKQVLAFQQRLIKHGAPSGAVGRYQIIPKTLRMLMGILNMPDSTKFSAATQDFMFRELLKRRGFDRWKAGAMSDTDFINGLSHEWASIPNSKGVGSYKGQDAGVSLEDLNGVLKQLKAA